MGEVVWFAILWIVAWVILAEGNDGIPVCPAKCLCDEDVHTVSCRGVLNSELASLLQRVRISHLVTIENSNIPVLKNKTMGVGFHIQELAVTKSYLHGVEADAFQNLRNLTKLNLSSNKIQIIGNPISLLDKSFNSAVAYLPDFITSRWLRYVDLSNNDIKFISDDELYGLKFVQHLNLSQNNIPSITFSYRYLMGVKVLDLSFNRISEVDRKFGELQMVMEELYISNNYIKQLPEFNQLACDHLRVLQAKDNEFPDVGSVGIKNCGELTVLDLEGNEILSIGTDDFTNNIKLQQIDLAKNQIVEISDGAFLHNTDVAVLVASDNSLSVISSKTLIGLKNVEILDFNSNIIESIAEDAFDDNKLLQYITLQNNLIRYLYPNTFYGLSLLKVVNLQDNHLTVPFPEWFLTLGGEYYYDDTKREVVEKIQGSRATFLLNNNPWMCYCQSRTFNEWATSQDVIDSKILPKITCYYPSFHSGKNLLNLSNLELNCDGMYLAASYFLFYCNYIIVICAIVLAVFYFRRKALPEKSYHLS